MYDPNDRQHGKAVSVFKNIERNKQEIVVHALVVVETLSIIKYKKILGRDLEEIRINLIDKRKNNYVSQITIELGKNDWKLLEADNKIGLVDILLIDCCRKNNLELVTFDKHLNECWVKGKRVTHPRQM
ncbi:hypothetical protein COU93_01880 [Candidatus Shapirobacteria bacterium CG10_big_fil_rev_8_21_14_0_10_36_6]|uniref:PIN domain-containing protein n=1 Tax=Candidatus Shapirobacteria bacterium CG10_big_fil_rev_8_21_14_0_10_36_6 TaxID=1974886 RepID=A0A2M8L1S4_9BACT|nr:MAG: hypothetical protein COU93_01880 [Candidatus Shapirobacteria bacterium CG10_big_fil_rev_8_21_14_0_10_36_6]